MLAYNILPWKIKAGKANHVMKSMETKTDIVKDKSRAAALSFLLNLKNIYTDHNLHAHLQTFLKIRTFFFS